MTAEPSAEPRAPVAAVVASLLMTLAATVSAFIGTVALLLCMTVPWAGDEFGGADSLVVLGSVAAAFLGLTAILIALAAKVRHRRRTAARAALVLGALLLVPAFLMRDLLRSWPHLLPLVPVWVVPLAAPSVWRWLRPAPAHGGLAGQATP